MSDTSRREHRILFAAIGKIVGIVAAAAMIFVVGIVIATQVNDTTFSAEWANMIAWFKTWAK